MKSSRWINRLCVLTFLAFCLSEIPRAPALTHSARQDTLCGLCSGFRCHVRRESIPEVLFLLTGWIFS